MISWWVVSYCVMQEEATNSLNGVKGVLSDESMVFRRKSCA
jgi:hypothetical protein